LTEEDVHFVIHLKVNATSIAVKRREPAGKASAFDEIIALCLIRFSADSAGDQLIWTPVMRVGT
jgi:hypothetical protein